MHTWYQCNGLDLQRGAYDNKKITLVFIELHLTVKLLGQILTKEHNVRLHDCFIDAWVTPTTLWNYLQTKPINGLYYYYFYIITKLECECVGFNVPLDTQYVMGRFLQAR